MKYNIAIIGCGQIADHHLKYIKNRKDIREIILVDSNINHVKSFAVQHKIKYYYHKIEDAVKNFKLDVAHICTPPKFHYEIAKYLIKNQINILIEKPVVYKLKEIEELIHLANLNSVILTANFLQLFNPIFLTAKNNINQNKIGKIKNIQSFYSIKYPTSDLKNTFLPWQYRLPAGILHNHISHPIYLNMYLLNEIDNFQFSSNNSNTIKNELNDNFDILLTNKHQSSSIKISLEQKVDQYFMKIFGEKGIITIDFNRLTITSDIKGDFPNIINRFFGNYNLIKQLFFQNTKNIINIIIGNLKSYNGMQILFNEFYLSIQTKKPPIDYNLIKNVINIEEIISKKNHNLVPNLSTIPNKNNNFISNKKILITGGTGVLGSDIARYLTRKGYYVRVTSRPFSNLESIKKIGAEIFFGDIRDINFLKKASQNIDIIIHAAAGMSGSKKNIYDSTILGTKNIAKIVNDEKIKCAIYISSVGIYDFYNLSRENYLDEESKLETNPKKRGAYTSAKRLAEDVILKEIGKDDSIWTILRPSLVLSENINIYKPLTGIKLNNFFIYMGNKKNLRLVSSNLVSSVIHQIILGKNKMPSIFNVSEFNISVKKYLSLCRSKIKVVYLPFSFIFIISKFLNFISFIFNKKQKFSKNKLYYWYSKHKINTSLLKNNFQLDYNLNPKDIFKKMKG